MKLWLNGPVHQPCVSTTFQPKILMDSLFNFIDFHRDPDILAKYKKILKTTGMNKKEGHICCQHWSKGERTNVEDLPDIPPVPATQFAKFAKKYENAKSRLKSAEHPTQKQRKAYKINKRKYDLAQCLKENLEVRKIRKLPPIKSHVTFRKKVH